MFGKLKVPSISDVSSLAGPKAAAKIDLAKDAKDAFDIIKDMSDSIQKLSDGGDVSHKIG